MFVGDFENFSSEGTCKCLYDSSRCCKILGASLKLDDKVFNHLNSALTRVEIGIRELPDAFDRFCLSFGSSSPVSSASVFSIICFRGLTMDLKCFSNQYFLPFYQFLKRNIFYEINYLFCNLLCFLSQSLISAFMLITYRCIDNN